MEDLYRDVGSAVVYMLSGYLKLSALLHGHISSVLHPVVTNANGRPCRFLRPHAVFPCCYRITMQLQVEHELAVRNLPSQ